MRDALADEPAASWTPLCNFLLPVMRELQGTQKTYNVLKGYLMLARPDKADGPWLAANMLKAWPTRAGVTDSIWQTRHQNCWLLCAESAVSSGVGNQA
jgi:type VI secretion system protein ImpL